MEGRGGMAVFVWYNNYSSKYLLNGERDEGVEGSVYDHLV